VPTAVVTGGAGFLGSHLCDSLVAISRAKQVLGREPEIELEEGLRRMLAALGRGPVVA
jgi:nucleoside-diphosphate-sugar epimerase